MKKLYVCQVVDRTSESIISTFTAPTPKYFDRQMETFFEDCKKKSIPVGDFVGMVVASVDVCETFDDAMSIIDETYHYEGTTFVNPKEIDDEVPSNVQ